MNRKKVLHVVNWIGLRGSEKTCLNFAKHTPQYDHTFIARTITNAEAEKEFIGVGEVRISINFGTGGMFDYSDITPEFIKENNIDIINVYLPGDNLPSYIKGLKDCGVKIVLSVLCAKKCHFGPEHFDSVVVLSEFAASLNPHLNPEWVYPTVEVLESQATKDDILLRYFDFYELAKNPILISRVGSIEQVKHVEDFLKLAKTFEYLDNVYFLYAGVAETSYLNKLKSKYYGINIAYGGVLTEQEKNDINAVSDVCLYPTEFESFGYSLAEPMSHGVPVVTYNESASPETVGDGGVVVDFNNLVQLTKALAELMSRPLLRKKLGDKALARWETSFAPGIYQDKVVAIYEGLLNE